MKLKRLLYITPVLVVLLVSVASSFLRPVPVSAENIPSSDGHPHAQITLTGTSSPTDYKVSGKLGSTTSVGFKYDPGKKAFFSDILSGVGNGCANNTDKARDNLVVSVALASSGKSAANNLSMDFCDTGSNTQTASIAVKEATNPASFSGKITYKDSNGKSQPFKSGATGTLTGGPNNQTIHLSFDDSGNIKTISPITPGNYRLTADYPVPGGQNQNYTKDITIKAGQPNTLNNAVAGNVVAPGNGQDPNAPDVSASSDQGLGCDGSSSALAWIICPIVKDIFVPLIGQLDKLITNQLFIDTGSIFCGDSTTCNDYHSAWSSFRNIALGLMVIAGLIAVIAQALGMEILDAYTIRKILPRVLIVAIGITLSWPLMSFFVTLTNELGIGIRHLIEAPFSNFSKTVSLDFGSNGPLSAILNTAGVGAGAVLWIAAGGFAILFSYAGTAALAVLVAILVLILRQIAITMLILVAPLAIVAYILPNTQKYYKFWWESFSKALLMFPFIIAIIATGRIFSAIALKNGGTDIVSGSIGLIAYFAPYFLIPFTFKFAGGVLSNLGGAVSSRGQGAFGALAKQRSDKRKERFTAARGAGLYKARADTKGIRRLGHYANKLGFYTLNADEQVPYALGSSTGLGKIGKGKYNPIGIAGRALFRGTAEEMAGMKARQKGEHTLKGMQDSGLHYAGAYGVKGMREKFADDLTPEARDRLDRQFGTREVYDSSKVMPDGSRGGMVKRWKNENMPASDDTQGWLNFGRTLEENSRDGSNARKAGEELRTRSGVLTRLGKHPETQRATIRTVADAVLSKEGKISPDDLSRTYDEELKGAGADPAGRAMATTLFNQNEALAAQNRYAMRSGKAVRQLDDGTPYSVLADKVQMGTVQQGPDRGKPLFRTTSGGTTVDPEAADIFNPSHTEVAQENLLTVKHGQAEMSKGEFYDDIWHAADFWAQDGAHDVEVEVPVDSGGLLLDGERVTRTVTRRQYSSKAEEIRKNLIIQASTWSQGDAGAQDKLNALLAHIHVTDEEKAGIMRSYNAGAEANLAGGGGPPEPPDAAAAAGPTG